MITNTCSRLTFSQSDGGMRERRSSLRRKVCFVLFFVFFFHLPVYRENKGLKVLVNNHRPAVCCPAPLKQSCLPKVKSTLGLAFGHAGYRLKKVDCVDRRITCYIGTKLTENCPERWLTRGSDGCPDQ